MSDQGRNSHATPALYLALELGLKSWKLAFTTGLGQKPRFRTVPGGGGDRLLTEIERAKVRFGLAQGVRVVSLYEAGRDGFWLHRFLGAHGVENVVVDSSSIEVNRRRRRAKTDRLDATKLLSLLIRRELGEQHVFGVVVVPEPEDEDERHLHRALVTLKRERTRVSNRIRGLLFNQGIRMEVDRRFREDLEGQCLWDGSPLGAGVRYRVLLEYARWEQLQEQISEVEAKRRALILRSDTASAEKARRLLSLQGLGVNGAWLLTRELFSWRRFRNRRELASYAGLCPTPHRSGEEQQERGISKAGNTWVRTIAVELAWGWLRLQPDSELSRWYRDRFGGGGPRLRKIGIVALARKLLIALWRFSEGGVLPEGAQLKSAPLAI
jgi:transposase